MIYNIYEPVDWTSFDVVKKIRGITKEKKVGHGGTLDPFAEGVLIIGTGKDAKITIESSSKMSEEDVEKMKTDAEKFAEEDKKKKETVDINGLGFYTLGIHRKNLTIEQKKK